MFFLFRNPVGRTGVKGRGTLARWGPNQAADPIITRYEQARNGRSRWRGGVPARRREGPSLPSGGGVDVPARRGPRSGGVRILPRSGEARSGRLSREAEAAGSLDILQPILESNLHNTSNKAGPPDPTCIWTRSCKKLSFVLKPMKDLDLALKTK